MDAPFFLNPDGNLFAWQTPAGVWMAIDLDDPSRVMMLEHDDVAGWTPLLSPAVAVRRHYAKEARRQRAMCELLRHDLHLLTQRQRTNPASVENNQIVKARSEFVGAQYVEKYVTSALEAFPADADAVVTS